MALRPAEIWKTKFKQALNTSTLDDIFNKMLDKQKSSVDAGNDITSRELTNLFGINYNAQNCGAPTTSTGGTSGTGGTGGTSGSSSSGPSRLKKLFSSKPKTPGAGPPGAAPPGATTPNAAKVKLTSAEVLAKHEEDTKKHIAAVEEEAALKAAEIKTRAERTAAGTHTASDKALNMKDAAALAASKAAEAVSANASRLKQAFAQTGKNVLASLRGGPRAVPAASDTASEMASVAAGGGQEGGGRRRHNRTRYISDIKNNRRRLYEREKEIIQSIRNFEKGNIKSHHNKTRKFGKMLRRR